MDSTRFCALVGRLGGDPGAAAAFDALDAAWGEPNRRYHGRAHLADCLRELDGVAPGPTRDVAELALWYHDAIYEPYAKDNEERSARMLLAAIAVPAAAHAAALVRATAHAKTPEPPALDGAALVLDVDLSVLGRDPQRFMAYEHAIEEEYAPASVPAFRAARGRFLAALLARPRIYHTEHFHARYEPAARANLAALLAGPRYAPFVR